MTKALADWLADRSDAELAELLRLRPDLAAPPPASMVVLANRAEARSSVLRVADEFDTAAFVVIDAMQGALDKARTPDAGLARAGIPDVVAARLAVPVDTTLVEATLDRLITAAVVWGEPDQLRLTGSAVAALPWPVGATGDGYPANSLTEEEIADALAGLDEPARALLDRLANTVPVGRTRDAAPGTPDNRPVQQLLARRLLRWVDEQTVELPATVGRVLRGEPFRDPRSLTPPPETVIPRPVADVDGAAAGEVLELLRHSTDIVENLGQAPAPAVRSGALGTRELRRIAKQTGIDQQRIALLVELLAAASLIARGKTDTFSSTADPADDYWAPTLHVDAWLDAPAAQRWTVLANAWLDMPRRPWLIGMRDSNGKPVAALSDEVNSPAAAQNRRDILAQLAASEPGGATSPADLVAALTWRRPRQAGRFRRAVVEHTLTEAGALGIVARGALSSPGRALLSGDAPDVAMAAALPTPIDYVLVQPDLTIIAPGPLTAELRHNIIQVADLESAGGATVYRVGEKSVRRALDAGATASELHSLFRQHSRTPVPQALTYLIDDVARKHGKLRAGAAESFIRSDDPAQLAEVLAAPIAEALALRPIAATVAVSPVALADVIERLREAGFTPAAEDSHGAIVDLRLRGARIVGRRRPAQFKRSQVVPSDEQLQQVIERIRANDTASRASSSVEARTDGSRTGGPAIMALLQLAVRAKRRVTITYIDNRGTAVHRVVDPVAVAAGQLDCVDHATGIHRHFPLHRIATAALVD